MPEPFSPSLRAGGALGSHTPGGPQVVFEKVEKKIRKEIGLGSHPHLGSSRNYVLSLF